MLYDELHQKYGGHVAKRVQRELSLTEFGNVAIEELVPYLEIRAETAHKKYQTQYENPLADNTRVQMTLLCRRWRDAEDLAYLITVAEDVSGNARALANQN